MPPIALVEGLFERAAANGIGAIHNQGPRRRSRLVWLEMRNARIASTPTSRTGLVALREQRIASRWVLSANYYAQTADCDPEHENRPEGRSDYFSFSCPLPGAGNRTRTDDLLITNQLLYQLSYPGPGPLGFRGFFVAPRTVGARGSIAADRALSTGWGRFWGGGWEGVVGHRQEGVGSVAGCAGTLTRPTRNPSKTVRVCWPRTRRHPGPRTCR